MSIQNTILKNTAWLTVGSILTNIFSYILIVAIARTIGDVGLGQYSFIFSIIVFTFIFSDLGVSYLMIRELARNKKLAQKYFENVLSLKVALGFFSIFITFVLSFFLDKDPLMIKALWLAGIVQFFVVLNVFFANFFKSFDLMHFEVFGNLIERTVAIIFGVYVLYANKSIFLLVLVLLISKMCQFAYFRVKLKDKIVFKFGLDIEFLKKIIINGFPFFLTSVFFYLYFKIDTVMLSLMIGDE
ncbi:hypothetical protein BVY04_01445, partial [bacterium M21]